ncbi:hypothetical protein MMC15_007871 [Xylographa vitiligo]|nr:hypothetical protein [Xylographa vitiligo]
MLTISPKQEPIASSTAARDSASRTRRTHLVDVNTIKNSMHLHHEQTAISDIHDTPPASYRVAPKALRGQRGAPGRGTHPHLGRQRPVRILTARATSWSRRSISRPPSRARIRLRLLFSLRGGSMPRSEGWRRPGRSAPARPTPPDRAREFPPVVRRTPRALPGSLRGLSDDATSKGGGFGPGMISTLPADVPPVLRAWHQERRASPRLAGSSGGRHLTPCVAIEMIWLRVVAPTSSGTAAPEGRERFAARTCF